MDRETGQVLLGFADKFATDVQFMVHDQNTLIGRIGSSPNQLSRVNIPWSQIRNSQAAIEAKEPAYIAPYQSVDIRIDINRSLGAAKVAEDALMAAIRQRLARDGITVKRGAENYFRLRLSENPGDTLPITESQSPFDFRGRDTGRTAIEAKGSLIVEFYRQGNGEPLWEEKSSTHLLRACLLTNRSIKRPFGRACSKEFPANLKQCSFRTSCQRMRG